MDKVTKVFYYYTLLLLTVIFISSIFFLPAPFNLTYPLLMSPSLFYFWLRVTDPIGATETTWSMRIVTVLVLLAGLTLFGFYLQTLSNKEGSSQLVDSQTDQTASLSAELKILKEELLSLKNQERHASDSANLESISQTELSDLINSLPESNPSPSPIPQASGSVRVTSTDAVNIYEQNSLSSKITGIAEPGSEYEFIQETDSWYLIQLESERVGWIQAKEVLEFN